MGIKIAILCLLMTGCTVDGYEINNAFKNCKEHNGVDYIRLFTHDAICNDGALVGLNFKK